MIFQISSIGFYMSGKLPFQSRMRNEFEFMRDNVLCNNSKSAKHILEIRRASVFECPGDSLDLKTLKTERFGEKIA